ncbi:hypothetical protein PDL71_15415 [Lacibacter sp. MH-610]|uniref:hypothetical protein n=1 Tax=Lacibacter sp. MH-610 TaxID=3020883 RepID=UPI003892479E
MSIKYRITSGQNTYDFNTMQLAEDWKQRNNSNLPITEVEVADVVVKEPVPQSVPLWCLRTVLRSMNLLQPVKDTIAAMPDGVQKIAAEEGIEYSNTVLRSSPTTLFIKQVLNLTDEQVDEIFINADKVEA